MTKYEYKHWQSGAVDAWRQGEFPKASINELGRLGNEGWDLVQVVDLRRGDGRSEGLLFIFKRELSD